MGGGGKDQQGKRRAGQARARWRSREIDRRQDGLLQREHAPSAAAGRYSQDVHSQHHHHQHYHHHGCDLDVDACCMH